MNTGIQQLISFLERKASPPKGPPLKIYQHHLEDDLSLLIEVDMPTSSRFTHLDGFSFAGATLKVQPYSQTAPQNRRQPPAPQNQPTQANGRSSNKGDLFDRVSRSQGSFQKLNPFSKPNRQPQTSQPHPRSTRSTSSARLPAQGGRFQDLDGIGEKFIRAFFPLYDSNREQTLKDFYDDDSSFSLSVQTRSRHVKGGRPPVDWSSYIRHSRNLTRIHNPKARAARLCKGQYDIYETWSQLPKTQHPSLETHLTEWLLECMPVDSLPDPGGNTNGVKGLMVTAHGAFDDATADGKIGRRAFDRTFIIGPGGGVGGIRVISDVLVLRPYTGNFASLHNSRPSTPTPQPNEASSVQDVPKIPSNLANGPPGPLLTGPIQHPEVTPGSGVGEPREGKSPEQLMKEQMVLQLSFTTKLKLAVADQCLTGNNWNMEAAVANVQQLVSQGQLGPDAFLNV